MKVREIIHELNEAGWYQLRQTGSHRSFGVTKRVV
jgi:predicted RNA binding protein YcfA (HicA-like mRNA interferase family)